MASRVREKAGSHAFKRVKDLFVSLALCFCVLHSLLGCSGLVKLKVSDEGPFVFEGAKSLRERPDDGRWILRWDGVAQAGVSYEVFLREIPKGSAASSPDSPAFDFASPTALTSDDYYVSESLLLKNNTCFLVRLKYSGYTDSNQKEMCTGHTAAIGAVVSVANPVFVSLNFSNAAFDKALNAAERNLASKIFSLQASHFIISKYAIVSGTSVLNDCAALPENSYSEGIPQANDPRLSVDGNYKACVELANAEGRKVYGISSESLAVDTSAPADLSLSLANAAADGIVNAGEAAGTTPVVNLSGTGSTIQSYSVVKSIITACDSSQNYVSEIPSAAHVAVSDGSKKICVRASDAAGNIAYAISPQIVVDKTPPDIRLSTPDKAGITSVQTVSLTVTLSDTGSGIDPNTISLTTGTGGKVTLNGASTNCVPTVTGTGNSRTISITGCSAASGSVTVSIAGGAVSDLAGNNSVGTGPSASFTVDNLKPNLSITSPAASTSVHSTFNLQGTCEVSLSVIASVLDGGTTASGTCSAANTFTLPLEMIGADGNRTVAVSTSDGVTGIVLQAVTIVKDATAPAPTISSPAADTVFASNSVSTTLTGACEAGLTVTLGGDVTSGQTTACSGSYSFSNWTLTSGDGNKLITVSQSDAAGNVGTSTARRFVVMYPPAAPTLNATNVSGLKGLLTGTCDSNASSHSATTTVGSVYAVTCSSGVLTVLVHLPEGSSSFSVTALSANAGGSTSSSAVTFTRTAFYCPTGYVGVPGKLSTDADINGLGLYGDGTSSDVSGYARAGRTNSGYDPTRDFCVMKYPAKVATSNYGGQQAWEPVYDGNKDFITGSAPTIAENYWPESRADSTPWVNISRDEAADRCKALNEAYGHCSGNGCYSTFDNTSWGYRLISNTQWQVIARNLESTGANWTSGIAGTGYLWRGHSDGVLGANTDLHTQTCDGTSQISLSHSRSDSGNSDYFGTGNEASQNSSGTSGWQERRRFVLSTGASVWDMAGNVWHWMSDDRSALGIPDVDNNAGLTTGAWISFLNSGSNRFSSTLNLIFGSKGIGGLQISEAQNAGQIWGGPGGAVRRGGRALSNTGAGLFSTNLHFDGTVTNMTFGFRCVYVPPIISVADTNAPTVSGLSRTNGSGTTIANTAITVGDGGFWNLNWTVLDAENVGADANKIFVQVRRKISASNSDFPTESDAVYKSGFKLSSLSNETAWELNSNTHQYARNDGKFVNYRITAIDPSGNKVSANYSVQNIQSCPPGYVGVPGNLTSGLGNVNATVGNSKATLDPSRDFCMMKYPAKVMSAGTTAAQNTVGGLLEPIMNGNAVFSQETSGANAVGYSYTNSTQFNASIRYLPESRFSGSPWVNLTRSEAIGACRAQQMQFLGTLPDATNGTGFQLTSNTQWQVTARNIEAQSVNWSDNAVGSGVLNRGHSDGIVSATELINSWCFGCIDPSIPLTAAPNSISDENPYFATGNSSGAAWNTLGASPALGTQEKRTHTLSNGSVLWDMAGNVWKWMSDNNEAIRTSDDMGVSDAVRAWKTSKQYDNAEVTTSDKLLFSGLGQYTGAQNAGMLMGDTAGAILRGGAWPSQGFVGLFTVGMDYNTTADADVYTGFRCVYVPTPNTVSGGGDAPQISALGRVNDVGEPVENSAVTIAGGGVWNLKWRVSDTETASSSLAVEVRRKITSVASDFPTTSDAVYTSGNGLTQLRQETSWQSATATNNGMFVNYLISVIDAQGNISSRTFSVQNTASCPAGYVGVPGNSTAGLGNTSASVGNGSKWLDPSRAFCVMKYPAKNVSGVATSAAADTPWVNITRDNAVTTCSALGTNFALISNTLWQVVARNAESVKSNWSGGVVGAGVLTHGHSDNSPSNSLANSSDDTDGYFGTGNSSLTDWSSLGSTPPAGTEQKRTQRLTNGAVIWDFAGNVWQWILDNRSGLGISVADDTAGMTTNGWLSYLNGGSNRFSEAGHLIFGSLGSGGLQFSEAQNVGQFHGGAGEAVMRGGSWLYTSAGGLFSASLAATTGHFGNDFGFRCVYMP